MPSERRRSSDAPGRSSGGGIPGGSSSGSSSPSGKPAFPPRLRLWELLRQGRRLTQAKAARLLGVTKRHVRRLVADLRDEKVPVREGREAHGGGQRQRVYYFDGPDLAPGGPFDRLSERQALALLVAAEAARPTLRPTPLDGPLQVAREELATRLAPGAMAFEPELEAGRWHFDAAAASVFDPEVFEILRKAIQDRRSVRMDYTTASTGKRHPRRRIDPLLLGAAGSSWVVVAYCHKRKEPRDFALAGINAVWPCDPAEEPGAVHFDPPEGFDAQLHFKGRFSALAGGEDHLVRLLAGPEAAPYFQRKKYHPTQQIDEERPDGSVVASFEVAGLEEVASFVRSWGTGVEVLAPEALAEKVAGEAQAVAHMYADTASAGTDSSFPSDDPNDR